MSAPGPVADIGQDAGEPAVLVSALRPIADIRVRRQAMSSIVASETLLAQRPGEDPFEIEIRIGLPYKVGTEPEEWACPVALKPLYAKLHDDHAGSSFQALCLASALILELLDGIKAKGGKLLYAPGEGFPLEAYAFGVAVRPPAGSN
jgi:hypothetical protein